MGTALFLNPRKKRHAKRKTHSRKRRVTRMSVNPRRKRHHKRVGKMRRNPRRSRGGSMSMKGIVSNTLIPAAMGAGGAVALNVLMGYLPLPTSLNTPTIKPIVGLAGALAMGLVANKFLGPSKGAAVGVGAATVVIYNLANTFLSTTVPAVPLSGLGGYPSLEFYAAGSPAGNGNMGVYQRTLTQKPANRTTIGNMGMYVR